MRQIDTQMGGEGGTFPRTSWSVLERLRKKSDSEFRKGMELLCTRYWKPVYTYARIRWSKKSEESKDLTQAFFLWLLESQALDKYDRERGSFRRFLKVLLGGFVAHEHRGRQTIKRGGDHRFVPLDNLSELEEALPDSDPERAFDRSWASEVIRFALEQVKAELIAAGKEIQVRVYEQYEMSQEADRPSYADIAKRLKIKESDVRNHLFAVREKIRGGVRTELSRITSTAKDMEDEWGELFLPNRNSGKAESD